MLFDAAVIGAGPAGCTAAHGLARRGARVALIDGSHPREKPCGGGVTSRALDLLSSEGLHVDAEGPPIDRAVFESDSRSAAFALGGEPVMRVFARQAFDRALLHAASVRGSTHVPSRATGIERNGSAWTIRTASGAIRARWLIGADGPAGIVRKHVFRPFTRSQLSIAAGSFADTAGVSEIVIRFVDEPPGYLWSFPRRDHLAVGVCAQADAGSTGHLHAAAERWIDAYSPARDCSRRPGWSIRLHGRGSFLRCSPARSRQRPSRRAIPRASTPRACATAFTPN